MYNLKIPERGDCILTEKCVTVIENVFIHGGYNQLEITIVPYLGINRIVGKNVRWSQKELRWECL